MDMPIWCLHTAFNTAVCIYHTGRYNAQDRREKVKAHPTIKLSVFSHDLPTRVNGTILAQSL